MIATAFIIAAAAAYVAVRVHTLSGSLPRGNDDMIFY